MLVTVNGNRREFDRTLSIKELIKTLDLPSEGIAVALNGTVVLKNDHATTMIADNDVIEIIRAVAGG